MEDQISWLNQEAVELYQHGRYSEAHKLAAEACELARSSLDDNHPLLAMSLSNRGEMSRVLGDYAGAEPDFRAALRIKQLLLPMRHPSIAITLNNLGELYREVGKYADAEPLFLQALEIRRSLRGDRHSATLQSLGNLATLYHSMGDYIKAESLYREAIDLARDASEDARRFLGQNLSNLAFLYREMGDYEQAMPLAFQARDVLRQTLGENHPDYITCLESIAVLFNQASAHDTAEELFKQTLDLRRRNLGHNHPDVAFTLNNLATLYASQRHGEAVELAQQACEILRGTVGDDSPAFAHSLSTLAALKMLGGEPLRAESLLTQAINILRTAGMENHPYFADHLGVLAVLYVNTDRDDDAFSMMQLAVEVDRRMIGQVFSIGSESQRLSYLQRMKARFEIFLSLVHAYFLRSNTAAHSTLDLVLQRKAIVAETLAAQRDGVLGGQYPELEPKLRELTILRTQIAQKTLAGTEPEGMTAHHHLLSEWNARKEQLEKDLARQIPEINLEQKLRATDRQAVALALSPGAVLVEFARFNVFDFMAIHRGIGSQWKPPRYLAFVLPSGEPDNVQMIDLGAAEPLDQMLATFRSAITGEEAEARSAQLEELSTSAPDTHFADAGSALRRVVFDPLLTGIGQRKRLLLAPDGDLSRLPFEALPTNDGRYLIDDYQISYLSVGRDLLRFGSTLTNQATDPVVIADPNFDFCHAGSTGAPASAVGSRSARLGSALNRSHLYFGRLSGSEVEGRRIARMLGVEPWLADGALEARLKRCRSPRSLHLATHGFFLADQKLESGPEDRTAQMGDGLTGAGMGRFSGAGIENPLLRSGLALTGANTWLEKGILPDEAEDGILTAEDVSGLDLLATELVVLSACETGLGEIHIGEGVFGLRRAFVLAGAKTLVMSLWKVSDLSTAILMERFYENLLTRNLARDESLREAQFYTRDISIGQIRDRWLQADATDRFAAGDKKVASYFQRLARKPDEYRPFSEPYYWGGFICQGATERLRS